MEEYLVFDDDAHDVVGVYETEEQALKSARRHERRTSHRVSIEHAGKTIWKNYPRLEVRKN